MKALDLTGQRFGKLTIVGRSPVQSRRHGVWWEVVCDCGEEREFRASRLSSGERTSCGCAAAPLALDDVDDHPAPKFDYQALLDAVARLRARHRNMTIARACERLGTIEWRWHYARKHVASDEEAFEFSWHERISADEAIVKGKGA